MARTYEQVAQSQVGAITLQFCALQSQAEQLQEELARVQAVLKTEHPKIFRKLYPPQPGPGKDGLPVVDVKFPQGM